jgi:hypothetical protein
MSLNSGHIENDFGLVNDRWCMRTYLTLHLVALILVNQLFRGLTDPTTGDGLNPLLWTGFVISSAASLGIFFRLLKRGITIVHRTFAFFVAWILFYFTWSGSIVLSSHITHQRLMRVTDEVFVLFTNSSGQQFEAWNRDAQFDFLMAALPLFVISALLCFAIHVMTRHIWPQLRRNAASEPRAIIF